MRVEVVLLILTVNLSAAAPLPKSKCAPRLQNDLDVMGSIATTTVTAAPLVSSEPDIIYPAPTTAFSQIETTNAQVVASTTSENSPAPAPQPDMQVAPAPQADAAPQPVDDGTQQDAPSVSQPLDAQVPQQDQASPAPAPQAEVITGVAPSPQPDAIADAAPAPAPQPEPVLQASIEAQADLGAQGVVKVQASVNVKASTPDSDGTNVDIASMLVAHNSFRALHGIGPLSYDNDIAAHSVNWANQLASTGCTLTHGDHEGLGQNLYMAGGSYTPHNNMKDMVAAWTSESIGPADYNHATQVLWSTTTSVGCAISYGPNCEVLVCDYSPAGNVVGRSWSG
ncbi:CAP domain-containing protein [Chytriomyces sp. MP71]|nr:CAP domain-containing protein [Chytriomyces sp. MP71]